MTVQELKVHAFMDFEAIPNVMSPKCLEQVSLKTEQKLKVVTVATGERYVVRGKMEKSLCNLDM